MARNPTNRARQTRSYPRFVNTPNGFVWQRKPKVRFQRTRHTLKFIKTITYKAYDLFSDKYNNVASQLSKSKALIQSTLHPHQNPSFLKFGQLPVEIQTLIWEFAVLDIEPRIIEIRRWEIIVNNGKKTRKPRNPNFYHDHNTTKYELRSITPPPAMLYTSQLSRIIAKNHYELSFGTDILEPRIYFNFEKDTLYLGLRSGFFSSDYLFSDVDGWVGGVHWDEVIGFERVQNLAFRTTMQERDEFWENIKRFEGLKVVTDVWMEEDVRRFDLGRWPRLRLLDGRAKSGGLSVLGRGVMYRFFTFYVEEFRVMFEGLGKGGPEVRLGCFEKGEGERWFFYGESWPF